MSENSKDLKKVLQREKCFRNSIEMAFQDMISWPTLLSVLEEMTPTLVECRQLVQGSLE